MTSKKTLSEAGELLFISEIRKMMPPDGGAFIRSAGDDCLVAPPFGGDYVISTIDTFVDGVHFAPELLDWGKTGNRCMVAAVSDIAAMSGIPVFSLVSLSLQGNMLMEDAVSLFKGLKAAGETYCCPVAGGETTSTPGPATVTITVVGRIEPGRSVFRSGAKPGDSIYVTGTIGDAMAGLEILKKKIAHEYQGLAEKFIAPLPRLDLSRALTEDYSVNSMIDVSDGLATDLLHICEESGVGAEIDSVLLPLSEEFRKFCAAEGIDPVEFALGSGDEFELLFTSSDTELPEHLEIGNVRLTRIGRIYTGKTVTLNMPGGKSRELKVKGYEHFIS